MSYNVPIDFILRIMPDGEVSRIEGPLGYYPSKDQLRAIVNFCVDALSDYDEYEDHNVTLKQFHEQGIDPETEEPYKPVKSEKSAREGYIYFAVDAALPEYVKIGFSKDPQVREGTLQAKKPTISIEWDEKGTMADERALHEKFKDRRVRGEWFMITIQEAYDAIRKMKPLPTHEVVEDDPF